MIRILSSALLVPLFMSSCVLAIEADEGAMHEFDAGEHHAMAEQAPPQEDGPAAVPDEPAKPKEIDLDELEWAVVQSRASMDKAKLGAEISMIEAEQRVESAQVDLEDAVAELEHFDGYTAPRELAERALSIDRSEGRLFEAKAELQQLIDMYEDEEFATSSKELVLERGRRNVDFSERSLEFAHQALANLEAFDLAKRRAKLERGLEKAELGLRLAEMRLQSARMGWDNDERGLVRKLHKAEQALGEAREKIEAGDAVAKN